MHIRPNCVLVYGPMVSEGGRTLERFPVTADGIKPNFVIGAAENTVAMREAS